MRIAIERENASRVTRVASKLEIDILPVPVAVELYGDPPLCRSFEYLSPVSFHARPGIEHAPAGMTEDRHTRSRDGSKHPGSLILGPTKLRMRRGNHELELRTFAGL